MAEPYDFYTINHKIAASSQREKHLYAYKIAINVNVYVGFAAITRLIGNLMLEP